MKKGIFIVIDGIDGTGKATQTALLMERLKKLKIPAKKIDFPGYERNVFGKLIGECLVGKHGDFLHSDPHIASVLYAADRFESKKLVETWLLQGKVVVADRYVSSNQIHQGGKIQDIKKKKQFLEWLDAMEHGAFGLPRPNLILYLNLPVALSVALLNTRSAIRKKRYLEGSKDTVESDMKYLENARNNALKIIEKNNHWVKINCAPKGELLSRNEISELIFAEVKPLLRSSGKK